MENERNIGVKSDTLTVNSPSTIIAGTINMNSSPAEDDIDKNLCCVFCGQVADVDSVQENGKITCKKCGNDFFEFKQFKKNATMHLNVPPEKQKEYDDIIFRVILNIQQGLYKEANIICDEAIKLFSQSPQGLEYKALCLYFTTPRKEIISTSARQILVYLENANEIDKTSKNYQNIAPSISFKYFRMLKYRIQNIQNKQKSSDELCKLISEFTTCYRIFPSIQFLKTQVSHLSGQEGYSLIIPLPYGSDINIDYQRDREISGLKDEKYLLKDLSTYQIGIFQKLSNIEKAIKKKEPKYCLPSIKIEYNQTFLTYANFLLLKKQEIEAFEEAQRVKKEQERVKAEKEMIALKEAQKTKKQNKYLEIGAYTVGAIIFSYLIHIYWITIVALLLLVGLVILLIRTIQD